MSLCTNNIDLLLALRRLHLPFLQIRSLRGMVNATWVSVSHVGFEGLFVTMKHTSVFPQPVTFLAGVALAVLGHVFDVTKVVFVQVQSSWCRRRCRVNVVPIPPSRSLLHRPAARIRRRWYSIQSFQGGHIVIQIMIPLNSRMDISWCYKYCLEILLGRLSLGLSTGAPRWTAKHRKKHKLSSYRPVDPPTNPFTPSLWSYVLGITRLELRWGGLPAC